MDVPGTIDDLQVLSDRRIRLRVEGRFSLPLANRLPQNGTLSYCDRDWTPEVCRTARMSLFNLEQYLKDGTATLQADFIEFPPDRRSLRSWDYLAEQFGHPDDLLELFGCKVRAEP